MESAVKLRTALADTVAGKAGLHFWQSEYCILGDNAGEINGDKRDLGMNAALYIASVIHHDLSVANASAWQWWTAISPYNYKDGLIYIDKNKADGNFYTSKMLWALGNYSRFVRPGAVRVSAVAASPQNKPLLVSAFQKGRDVTVVIINNNKEDVATSFQTGKSKINFTSFYLTSQDAELKAAKVTGKVNIVPGHSVVTLTGTIH
jgi:hypothetical protein